MNGRPVRMLFVVPDLMVGGAERHVTTLLPRLDPQRFSASVVCIGEEGGLFGDLADAGIDAQALHLGSKWHAATALGKLVTVMRRQQPDIVFVRGYNAETLGRIAARAAGVQHTVVWVHNITDLRPRTAIHARLDRALDRYTSAYFGVAEAQRGYMRDHLRYPDEKIRIILNGVDPGLFEARTDRGPLDEFGFGDADPVVGIVAELSPIKDHQTLLRAARLVVDRLPTARFLLIGDGACRGELERLSAELDLDANVRFTGVRRDVPRLLAALDVFTLSSLSECFSIALLEAMACGRPAVCTAVGATAEILDDGRTGYLVPPSDPRRLASRLIKMLSEPQTARRMGRAGRIRVETEFTLDRSAEAAQRAIEDVVMGQYVPIGRG